VATGDGKRTKGPLHGLRQRWLKPSPPLPVDDAPHPNPWADPTADDQDDRSEKDGTAPAGG
jgi:hypothetical protein